MPLSDDLYSPDANYSDGESINDQLSPADGYFGRDNPAGAMVPDPSQSSDEKTVEDKVLITRPEPRTESGSSSRPANSPTLEQLLPSHTNASSVSNAHSTSSPTATSPPAARSSGRVHPDALIMGGLPPPPAYSPSPLSATSPHALPLPQSPQGGRSYNTFGQRRLEDQLEQGYLPNREPENMGRPEREPNEATPLASVQVKRTSRGRPVCTKILFVALVLAVLSSVLTAVLKWKDSDFAKNPNKDIMPSPKLPGGPGRRYCASATYHKDPITFSFPVGGDLSVVQKTRENDDVHGYTRVDTAGEVRLRRFPKSSKSADGKGYATVVINVSHPDIDVDWTLEDDSRYLTVTTPRYAKLDSSSRHCVSLDVVVWIPEDATLTNLLISAVTLGLTVLDDIKVDVDQSKLESITGHISFPTPSSADTPNVPISHPEFRFDSRRVEIQTISGDINGLFPLLDSLSFISHSGNVDVSVLPHEALPSKPSPADLEVHTSSGDIDVRLPLLSTTKPKFAPPPRDYITNVGSTSGDISGTYYLGSSGDFETDSGDMTMKILPIVQYGYSDDPDKDPKVNFKTGTRSGRTEVEILEPMFISPVAPERPEQQDASTPYQPIGDNDPYRLIPGPGKLFSHISAADPKAKKLRNLQTSHNTTSGDVAIRVPAAWEGSVSGQTLSGDTSAEGEELRVIKNRKGLVHKELLARKGVDSEYVGSFTTIRTLSGDIRFVAGSSET